MPLSLFLMLISPPCAFISCFTINNPSPSGADIDNMNFMELPLITIDAEEIYTSAVGDSHPEQAVPYTRCGY